jgi:hypothetical protein
MSDLDLQLREVWKQPEGRLGSSENTSKPRRCLFFVSCFALFAHVPLVRHSELSILNLNYALRSIFRPQVYGWRRRGTNWPISAHLTSFNSIDGLSS